MSGRRSYLFDDDKKSVFLEDICKTGLIQTSAKTVGTTARFIRSYCDEDPEFNDALQDALIQYAESVQAEVHRRAVVGVEEPVFFHGEVCGHKRVYSDSLLTTLVKAKSSEFREKIAVDTTIHGGVLLTMPPAATQDEWLESTSEAPQLEEGIVDAEIIGPSD